MGNLDLVVLDLDRFTRGIRMATVRGDDARATVLYGDFLDRLTRVAEALGLDWDSVSALIEESAAEDAFTTRPNPFKEPADWHASFNG